MRRFEGITSEYHLIEDVYKYDPKPIPGEVEGGDLLE